MDALLETDIVILPNFKTEFRSLRSLLSKPPTKPATTFLECFINKAHLDGILSKENLFEIQFSDNYYEYCIFLYEEGISEILVSTYFTSQMPILYFLTNYKQFVRHPKIFSFNLSSDIGSVIDASTEVYREQNASIALMCYPFSIIVTHLEKVVYKLSEYTTIPLLHYFSLDELKGTLIIQRMHMNEQKVFKVNIPNNITSKKVGLDISSNYYSRISFTQNNERIEICF